ncbi:MAG: hypothetical protein RI988_1769 [Pseudomonadota bacterium]
MTPPSGGGGVTHGRAWRLRTECRVRLACVGLALLCLAWLAPASVLGQGLPTPAWQPRFLGVETARIELHEPRRLVLHVARVDLRARGVRWLATPPALPGAAPLAPPGRHAGETVGQFTSSFLREHGLQLAINAAPFGPVVDEEGTLLDVAGLQVSMGRFVSGQARQYPALQIMADGRARLARPPFELNGVVNAVGGFDIVLEGGLALFHPPLEGTRSPALHPRTAVGLAEDGWRAWLVVVDGRQPGYSEGVALHELAALLRALGATEGINLDGGGTSTLVVQGPDTEPLVLNRPIHRGEPGRERVSASHLGVWALPLPRSAASAPR